MANIVKYLMKLFADPEYQPLLDNLKKQRDSYLKTQTTKFIQDRLNAKYSKRTRDGGDDFSSSSSEDDEEEEQVKIDLSLDTDPNLKEEGIGVLKKILELFSYATFRDQIILVIGTIFAVIHGSSFPILALLFGTMSNTFYGQNSSSLHNGTTTLHNRASRDLMHSLMNKASSLTGVNISDIGHHNYSLMYTAPMSTDEFATYVSIFSLNYVYIGIAVFVSSFMQTACWEWAAENQIYRLRQQFIYQLCRQELSFLTKHSAGDLVLKLADDSERLREGIGHKFSMVLEYLSIFGFGLLIGFVTNAKLTTVFLASMPFVLGKFLMLWKLIASKSSVQQAEYAKAGGISVEVISSMRTVEAFGNEIKEYNHYAHALDRGVWQANRKYQILGFGVGIMYILIFGFYAFGFYYGVKLLLNHEITPGDIYTIFFSVTISTFAIGSVLPYITSIATAYGSADVIRKVIKQVPQIDPYDPKGSMPKNVVGRVKFTDVSFKWANGVQVLKNFNINILGGETVAIVGNEKCGKNVLSMMMLRFFDPQEGNIRLDNMDIRTLNIQWLRQQIAVVSASPVFFQGTILQNILMERSKLRRREVVKLAKLCCAHEFIKDLPNGYKTMIGVGSGKQLSSGQRQRLGILRAVARDPKILMLNSATSAIDRKTAKKIIKNIQKLRKGCTTIILTGKAGRVHDLDFIYIMDAGVIVESGTHEELLAKEGRYFGMLRDENVLEEIRQRIRTESVSDESSAESDFERQEVVSAMASTVGSGSAGEKTDGVDTSKLKAAADTGALGEDEILADPEILDEKLPSILDILGVISDKWISMTLGLIGCIMSGAVIPILALYLGKIFATFMKTGEELRNEGIFWTIMLAVLAIGAGIGYCLRTIFINTAGEYLTQRLRTESYKSILSQPLSWFDEEQNTPARLNTKLSCDVPFVKTAVGSRLGTAISALVSLITAVVISFFYGWELALITLLIAPIIILAIYFQMRMHKIGYLKIAIFRDYIIKNITRTIQDLFAIQVLSRALEVCLGMEKYFVPALREGRKQAIIYGFSFAVSESIIFLVFGGAFSLASWLIRRGTLNPTDLFTVFFAISFASLSFGQATSFVPEFLKAKLSAAQISKIIKTKSSVNPWDTSGLKPEIEGHIEFKDVWFSYPLRPNFSILNGLTLDIPAKKSIGIVGTLGGGKSTLFSILERFYEISAGEILIDGVEFRSINLKHYRSKIGFVPQDPILFNATIRNNIAYGLLDKDHLSKSKIDEKVEAAAKACCANVFIESRPLNYKTECGARGIRIPLAQRQLIAMARAIIRDPKILLLDDPTSNLNASDEKNVQNALKVIREGRTVIIVSNRPAAVEQCDLIGVLVKGKIVEYGTRDELIANPNSYYKSFMGGTPMTGAPPGTKKEQAKKAKDKQDTTTPEATESGGDGTSTSRT